ncbi:hypothetical protein PFNF54_00753, partial [Plasmodium falciparum NF54]
MAPQSSGGSEEDDIDHKSVKHLLDSIGKKVHDKVKSEANQYKDDLKGNLQHAKDMGERASSNKTCDLVKEYYEHFNGDASDKRQPCKKDTNGNDVERFSVKQQAEYDNKKMKCSNGSNGKNEGACASFRRLNLCNKNMENMDTNNNDGKAKHNLLAEVCLAAKYEGDSLKHYSKKLNLTYTDSPSQLCTELARSFADIGDIVRGKDLFLGHKQRKKELEKRLVEMFKNIQGNNSKLRTLSLNHVREYWWALNRDQVWKAITCDADTGNAYFRTTCSDSHRSGTFSQAKDKCRCKDENGKNETDQVPTYFDYVPQFLRWFEEWAEDFCRKKKKYVDIVKTYCREKDKYGNERYCSGNGYDCTKTIYKKGRIVVGYECTSCSVWCRMYEKWIDNQKKEFLKQRNKYQTEIPVNGRKRRSTTSNYKGYEKQFYEEFKRNYGDVNKFLQLLNKEATCKTIGDEKEKIDFTKNVEDHKNINSQGTFYHSQYCEVCPGCGVKHNGSEWKEKNNGQCKGGKRYTIKDNAPSTNIDVLFFGDKRDQIKSKMEKFCNQTNGSSGDCGGTNSDSSLCEPWQCYEGKHVQKDQNAQEDDDDGEYDKDYTNIENAGGLCILQNKNRKEKKSEKEPEQFQKTFNEFFYFWIVRFLNDSMYWRGKIGGCLKNKSEKCKNECNTNCKCFLKWIGKKKTEWGKIVEHFNTQKNLPMDHVLILKFVLKLEDLFNNIKSGYGNVKELKGIKNMLKEEEEKNKEEEEAGASGGENKNTSIDKLLKHEEDEANKCLKTYKENCQQQENPSGGRTGEPRPAATDPTASTGSGDDEDDDDDDDDEDDDDDDDDEDEEEAEAAEGDTEAENPEQGEEEEKGPSQEDPKVCETVDKALTGDTTALKDACPTKYGPKAPTSWKCIPSGDKAATSGEGDSGPSRKRRDTTGGESTTSSSATTGGKDGATGGSVCVPPRRRKLYVGGLTKWAEIQLKSQAGGDKATQEGDGNGGSETQPQGGTPSQPDPKVELLKAFVESAAVETFFLWDRYKKEWMAQKLAEQGLTGGLPGLSSSVLGEEEEQPPQSKLQQTGEIPPDFLRQMFYTLGDYRDILVGNSTHILEAVTIGSNNETGKEIMKAIQEKIQQILPQNGDKPGKTSGTTPQALWSKYAEPIWNGMIYALTYKDNTDSGAKGKPPTQDTQVKTKLWDENSKKPKKNAGPESNIDYTYENVVLKEDESGAKTTGGDTPLTNFISRPTYFRYLEEWGETFCRQRTKRLDKIKEDCEVDDDDNKCDGDGFYCTQKVTNEDETIKGFDCSTCARHCRFYKKWIERKKDEFTEQKNAYSKQKEKCKEGSESSKQFCGTLKDDAAAFLNKLKSGPCKNESGEGPIKFDDQDKTFKHTEYCGPCSQFTVDCKNCNGGHTKGKCKNKTITEEDIKTMNDHNHVVMGVIDNSAKGFDDGLEACRDKCIFEGIRNDVWKCGKVCGLDVCGLKNANGKNYDQIILIRALFKRWVENFFDDYKKIKHKISHCINNGNGSICTSDCGKKCNCVKDWITKKKDEWKNIKERFREQYKKPDNYNVRSVLEEVIPENHLVNTKNKVIKISKFDNSCACSASAISTNGNEEDAID